MILDNGIRFRSFPLGGIAAGAGVCLAGALGCHMIRRRVRAWRLDSALRAGVLGLLGFGLVLGMSFYAHRARTFSRDHIFFHYRYFIGEPVRVRGVVVSDVVHRRKAKGPQTSFELTVEGVRGQGSEDGRSPMPQYSGKTLVNIYRRAELNYGDEVELEGKLHRPYDFGDTRKFSYRRYLMRRKIPLILSVKKDAPVTVFKRGQGRPFTAALLRLRQRLKGLLERYLPPEYAGIMAAILLGDRTQLPDDIYDLFKKTGTAHVLAISGLHIAVIAALLVFAVRVVCPRRVLAYPVAVVFLFAYAAMTGGRPSVVRAAIMAGVFLFSCLAERETVSLNTLALAGSLILLITPSALFDIGFQLSFSSVLFILLFYPLLRAAWAGNHFFEKTRAARYFSSTVSMSLSAWLGASGLMAYYFEIVTPVALMANLAVIPLITLMVPLGLGFLLTALVCPKAAMVPAAVLKGVLALTVATVRGFSALPGASFPAVGFGFFYVTLYYSLLIFIYIIWTQKHRFARIKQCVPAP